MALLMDQYTTMVGGANAFSCVEDGALVVATVAVVVRGCTTKAEVVVVRTVTK